MAAEVGRQNVLRTLLTVVKCVVTAEGAVNSCRVLKRLPYMDGAAIEALEKWRFKPYLRDGKPVDVNYTFRLKLSLG